MVFYFVSSISSTTEVNWILALASTFVFANGLFGEYVHDDIPAVVRNPDVQGKTSLYEVFLNDFWGMRLTDIASHKSYRPLTILTFRLERWVLGFSCSFVSHLTNIILHMIVTLLYSHVLRCCLKLRQSQVLISGIIFAVHPIHTEAVTGIVGRADILSGLAFLLTFYFYNRMLEAASRQLKRLWISGFGVLVTFGVLCKETAFTVLLVCVMWEFILYVEKYKRWRLFQVELLSPMANRIGRIIFLASTLLLLRLFLMRTGPIFSRQDNPTSFSRSFQTRFLSYSYLPSWNMWLLLFPWCLSHDWQLGSVPSVENLSDVRNMASVCLFLSIIGLFCWSLRDRSCDSLAIFWSLSVLVCSFLPASNLFFRVGFVIAERILYTTSFGFCTIISIGFLRLFGIVSTFLNRPPHKGTSLRIRLAKSTFLIFVTLLAARTLKRNEDWRSRENIIKSGLKVLPHNAKMHYNYANLCRDNHKPNLAIQFYTEAIRLWPDYPSAHNNLGTVFLETGNITRAEYHFTQALLYNPGHFHAVENLATFLRNQNRSKEAILLLRKFLRVKLAPHSHPYENISDDVTRLGLLLADIYSDNRMDELEEEMYLILTTEYPMKADIHTSYGNFLVKQNKYDMAVRHFEAALSLEPTHSEALPSYASLIDTHFHQNQTHDLYKRALKIGWEPDIATSLGKAYLNEGKLEEAAEILTEVLQQDPHHLGANVHLAQVRLQQRQYPISESLLKQALNVSPNNRHALYHMSILLAFTNRSFEAIQAAKIAAAGCTQMSQFCATLYTHLADLMHTNAMLEPAIENYQIALDLQPSLVKALLNLGAIYHLQGNYSNAWEYYNKALEFEPSNSVLLENIGKLQKIYQGSSERLLEL